MDTQARYRAINRALWDAFDRGEVTQAWLTVERFRRLGEELALSCDPEAFNRDYLSFLAQRGDLFPGALALCRALREAGCVLAIATNGLTQVQSARLEASPLRPYISQLFTSQALGVQKPLPRFFELAMTRLGVTDPGRCLMVGDSLSSDIRGGRDAGLSTAWYNPKALPLTGEIRPTFTVTDYDQLKERILS